MIVYYYLAEIVSYVEEKTKGGGVYHAETGRRIRNLSTLWEVGSEVWLSRLDEAL